MNSADGGRQWIRFLVSTIMFPAIALLVMCRLDAMAVSVGQDFRRNYPPGYYGMYYYEPRFFGPVVGENKKDDIYRWDRYMSRITEVEFPFLPIPYDWDYGTGRTFGLPDYNSNDWP